GSGDNNLEKTILALSNELQRMHTEAEWRNKTASQDRVEFTALFNNRRKKEGRSPTQLYNILSIEIGLSASILANKLDLDDDDIDIIKKNKVASPTFLSLTLEILTQKDGSFVLLYGPAKVISDLVNKIKGEGQELKKKRRAEEELVVTVPKKRKWIVNSAITQKECPIVYFVDLTKQNAPLLESINRGEFVALHGSQASGKSTRLFAKLTQNVIKLQPSFFQLFTILLFSLYSASFEHVNMNNVGLFWQTLSMTLQHTVILFDEFDMLYNAMENVLALCLTTLPEGALVPGDNDRTFKTSLPFVHWIVLQQVIPHVFPTSPKIDVPYHPSMGTLNALEVLKQVICVFDQETIKSRNSFKLAHVPVSNANNREVSRESVYDTELYRIMSNWLGRFTITGQWHLKYRASGHINNKYVDIVILRPDYPTIALELLATATKKELKEHYEWALLYNNKLLADEAWVVHFTCCKDAISESYWPTESQLQKGLRVVYFWHDPDFIQIRVIAYWWNTNKNTRHITDVENW
ncbi:12054_t:CDS:2, partial [Gigaspora margarita]